MSKRFANLFAVLVVGAMALACPVVFGRDARGPIRKGSLPVQNFNSRRISNRSGDPAVTVSGAVTDGSGHGWPLYARIDISGPATQTIYTNPVTGAFSVLLTEGAAYVFHVSAVSEGYDAVTRPVTPLAGGSIENFSLTVNFSACNAPGYSMSGGLTEDFGTGILPDGWTLVDNVGNGEVWTFVDPENKPNNTGGAGLFAVINSDFYGEGETQDSELRTPLLDFSTHSTIHLMFRTDFNYFGEITPEIADVDVSADGGNSWTNVLRYQDGSTRGPHSEDLDISTIAGNHSNVIVRFRYYDASFAFWWQLDDVRLGAQCEPVAGGLLVGNVYDANTGDALNGARIFSNQLPAEETNSQSTASDSNVDDGFYILFSSLTGSNPFTASRDFYTSGSGTVNVIQDQVVQQNFQLAAGDITPVPTLLESTVPLGSQSLLPLDLVNHGGAPAEYRLFEGNGNTALTPRTEGGNGAPIMRLQGRFDPLRPAKKITESMKSKGEALRNAASTISDTPPWTSIADYPAPVMDNACATIAGKIYCAGGLDSNFIALNSGYAYDPAVDSWSPIAPMTDARDKPAAAAIGDKLYVVGGWGLSGDPLNTLEIYDPSTDSWSSGSVIPVPYAAATGVTLDGKFYVIGGCDTLSCGFTDTQVYDPDSDSWSPAANYPESISWNSCGSIDGLIYCAGGTSGNGDSSHTYLYDPSGNVWTQLADMPLSLWGAAFVASDNILYVSGGVTDQSSVLTNEGFAYDPNDDSWTPIANSNHTTFGSGSACGLYKIGGSIEVFPVAIAKAEFFPGLNNCTGSIDVPWLSENPSEGTIPPNGDQPVSVTFDAAQVSQPGDYRAHFHIKENTPYTTQDVQILMHVPLPAGWGYLAGNILGLDRCDVGGSPLTSATVSVDTSGTDFTLSTDENGHYLVAYDASTGPATITVSFNGYVAQIRPGVQITAGQTHTEDFTLRLNAPCIQVQPSSLEDTVNLGSASTLPLTLNNTGAAPADFQFIEGHSSSFHLKPQGKSKSARPIRMQGVFSSHRLDPAMIRKSRSDRAIPIQDSAPWMAIADFPFPVVDTTCAEIEGLIYCIGGIDQDANFLNSGKVYDPGSNTWSAIPDMTAEREKPAVAAIDGKLFVTGGWSSTGEPVDTLEIYDPATNSWSSGEQNPVAYAASSGVSLAGKFYVIGGCNAAVCGFTNVQVYDPEANSWSAAAAYPEVTSWDSCGAINGMIFCGGGVSDLNGPGLHTYAYDPNNNAWTQLSDMPNTQWGAGYTVSDQRLIVSGGVADSVLTNQGIAYDPTTDSWTPIANSNNTLFRGGSACGFYKIGGSFGGLLPVLDSEIYPGLANCGDAIDIPWLSENPASGTLAADGGQQIVDVTLDASQLSQPGDYLAHLRIAGSYTIPNVEVAMHVPLPQDWGTVQGVVSGLSRCDFPGSPLRRATVFVDTGSTDFTLTTDSTGHYQVSFPAADGPVSITAGANGYVTQTVSGVNIVAQQTTAQDINLRLDAPCASNAPGSFEITVGSNQSAVLPLTLNNAGGGDLNFSIRETEFPLQPLHPLLPKAIVPADPGRTKQTGPNSVTSLRFRKNKTSAPDQTAAWFSGLPVPGGLARYASAQCDTQPDSYYVFSGVEGVQFGNSRNSWRFDASSNTWNPLAPIPAGAQGPVATCYQGRIYVMGGSTDSNSGSILLYVYDISNNTWFAGASLPRPVWGAAAGAWNGKVFLIGGDQDFFGNGTSNEVDIYDIASDSWVGTGTSMPVATVAAGFAQAGPDLYIVGGWTDGNAPSTNNVASQRYDMSKDEWSSGPDLPSGRADFALSVTDTALYAMGGDDDGHGFFDPTNTVTRLEWSSWPDGAWTDPGDPLPAAYTSNNAGFCTQAIAPGSEVWSLGGISAFSTIDGTNFFRPSATEHCFTIYSDVFWLSESPAIGTVSPDSSKSVGVHFDASGLAPGDYHAVLAIGTNDGGAPQFNVPVTMHVALFHDDFNDGDYTSPSWSVTGPAGAWSAATGDLVGNGNRKIDAFSPTFGSGGCSQCTIAANIVLSDVKEELSLFGWYADKKNQVELRLRPKKGDVVFRQKSRGKVVAKHTSAVSLPTGDFAVQVTYDGVNFNVQLNGAASSVFSVPAGATPQGTFVFRLKSLSGKVSGTLKDVTIF